MKQIAEITLSTTWKSVESLVRDIKSDFYLDEEKTYIFHNNGNCICGNSDKIAIIETQTPPTEEDRGEIFTVLDRGEYKKDTVNNTTLYLRSIADKTKVNVKEI